MMRNVIVEVELAVSNRSSPLRHGLLSNMPSFSRRPFKFNGKPVDVYLLGMNVLRSLIPVGLPPLPAGLACASTEDCDEGRLWEEEGRGSNTGLSQRRWGSLLDSEIAPAGKAYESRRDGVCVELDGDANTSAAERKAIGKGVFRQGSEEVSGLQAGQSYDLR